MPGFQQCLTYLCKGLPSIKQPEMQSGWTPMAKNLTMVELQVTTKINILDPLSKHFLNCGNCPQGSAESKYSSPFIAFLGNKKQQHNHWYLSGTSWPPR